MSNYQYAFSEVGPYGASLRLLAGTSLDGRVVLDLGCGAGALADPFRSLGALYIGCDLDSRAVAVMAERGFLSRQIDLSSPDLYETLSALVGERQLAAILCLDVLEHLVEPRTALEALAALASDHDEAELVISVPNVGHVDLARQLLVGSWDMTDAGLLDRTHLRFFTEAALTNLMVSTGWYESAREDYPLERTDKHEAFHPAFEQHASLAALTNAIRAGADEYGKINQFVRRYHRGAARDEMQPEVNDEKRPFVSVVIRTLGTRPDSLVDVLCCLGGQTDPDFEIVLVVHGPSVEPVTGLVEAFADDLAGKTRVISCEGGTRSRPANAGILAARGRYVVFLDDDDLVTGNWIEDIRKGAERWPGRVVRWRGVQQRRSRQVDSALATHVATGPFELAFARDFDYLEHVRQNRTPFHCFAFPAALVGMGMRFDETLTVVEDWQFLLRAVAICGVNDVKAVNSVYNIWDHSSSAHDVEAAEWRAMCTKAQMDLDRTPLLLPAGSVRQIDAYIAHHERSSREIRDLKAELKEARRDAAKLTRRVKQLESKHERAERTIQRMRSSTSWRVSAPLRAAAALRKRGR